MKEKTKTIVTFLVIFSALAGLTFIITKPTGTTTIQPSTQTKFTTGTKTHSWEEIDINSGKVNHSFLIKNKGKDTLKLYNLKTSCACTTAKLIKEGETSPIFGMHTKSSYTMSLNPGETASLSVTFDPAYHGPSGIGDVTRQIALETKDPSNPEVTYTLTAMVRNK